MSARIYNQSGIAIGPILFVVAILAVLAGAIAAGSGSFNSNTSTTATQTQVDAILQSFTLFKQATARVQANGCSFNEVSFQGGADPEVYVNSNAPLATKPQCHIFQPAGGGISRLFPPRDALVSTLTGGPCCGGQYAFMAIRHSGVDGAAGTGLGSSAWCGGVTPCGAELMVLVPYLRREVCLALNERLKVANPSGNPPLTFHNPSIMAWQGNNINGTWFAASFGESTPVFAGCYESGGGYFIGFQVLLYN